MAIYHLHVKNISRKDGRSAIAAAAYRAGESLPNDAEESISNFAGKRDVRHSEILLPAAAPRRFADRATLWNAVEAAELRRDARLAKEIEFAIPIELPQSAWLDVVRTFADVYTSQGFIVDLAIHDDGNGINPHGPSFDDNPAVAAEGFGKKIRDADSPAFVQHARKLWEEIANDALKAAGVGTGIDSRSLAAQGLERTPGSHRGPNRFDRNRKRAMAREREGEFMKLDLITAKYRAELLAEDKITERFSHLAMRPDWPPMERTMPEGMTYAERTEFQSFWAEIEQRKVQDRVVTAYEESPEPAEERAQERHPPAYMTAAERAEQEADRLEAIALRELPEMDFLSRDATRQWRQLEESLNKQLIHDGYAPRAPADYEVLARDMAQFRETLAKLRAQEMQRALDQERGRPVPGPYERPISLGEKIEAEERMLDDMERPSGPLQQPAERATSKERALAEEDVVRAAEEPQSRDPDSPLSAREPRLAWITAGNIAPARESLVEQAKAEDRMDWLKQALERKASRDEEPEHEPERDRER